MLQWPVLQQQATGCRLQVLQQQILLVVVVVLRASQQQKEVMVYQLGRKPSERAVGVGKLCG